MGDYKTKYEAAIKQAKEELKACGNLNCDAARQIFRFFPELRESEDERIKKEIISYLRGCYGTGSEDYLISKRKQWIAWLEKQDEQKQDVNYPKFNFDDVLALQCCMETIKKTQEDKGLYEQLQNLHDRVHDAYWLEKQGHEGKKWIYEDVYLKEKEQVFQDGVDEVLENPQKYGLEKQSNQKPKIKYIYPKFRIGDVIEPVKPNGYCAPVRVKYIGEGNYSCEFDDRKSFLSFPICDENEYVLTEQKPTWSEEDEQMVNDIIKAIDKRYAVSDYQEMVAWLKSLKERLERMKGA